MTTSDARGNVYTLTVPARALMKDVEITMIPITSVAGQPTTSTLAAGVHLLPEGTSFVLPATLKIETPSAPSATIVPFTYDGDLENRHLYPAAEQDRIIEFQISHFSGYAALMASEFGELVGFFPAPGDRGDQALQELVTASETLSGSSRTEAMRSALQGWLDEVIKPRAAQVQALSTFDPDAWMFGSVDQLRNEMVAFDIGVKFAILSAVPLDELNTVTSEYKTAVKDTAKHVIAKTNPGCSTAPNAAAIVIAPWILAWQEVAQVSGAAALDDSLSRQTVIDELCVQVAFDPNTGIDFPTSIQAGQSGTLSVKVGYTVNDGPIRYDLPMHVTMGGIENVSPSGIYEFDTSAGSTAQKTFQWEPGTSQMRINVKACMGPEYLREVCQDAFVVRGEDDGGSGDIPHGTWFKQDHGWYFNGSSSPQPRPTRFIISRYYEDLGQLMGMYQIARDSQTLEEVVIPMYGLVITKTSDGGFEGQNSGTMFQGATGTVTVRGRVLPNGWLKVRWEASLHHGELIVGDEEIPPQ